MVTALLLSWALWTAPVNMDGTVGPWRRTIPPPAQEVIRTTPPWTPSTIPLSHLRESPPTTFTRDACEAHAERYRQLEIVRVRCLEEGTLSD